MLKILVNHIQHVPETCPRHTRMMVKHAQIMAKSCPRHSQNKSNSCLHHDQHIPNTSRRCFQKVRYALPRHRHKISNTSPQHHQYLSTMQQDHQPIAKTFPSYFQNGAALGDAPRPYVWSSEGALLCARRELGVTSSRSTRFSGFGVCHRVLRRVVCVAVGSARNFVVRCAQWRPRCSVRRARMAACAIVSHAVLNVVRVALCAVHAPSHGMVRFAVWRGVYLYIFRYKML